MIKHMLSSALLAGFGIVHDIVEEDVQISGKEVAQNKFGTRLKEELVGMSGQFLFGLRAF